MLPTVWRVSPKGQTAGPDPLEHFPELRADIEMPRCSPPSVSREARTGQLRYHPQDREAIVLALLWQAQNPGVELDAGLEVGGRMIM